MKILRMTWGALLGMITLGSGNPADAQGGKPDWVLLDDNAEHSSFYYDKAGVEKLGKEAFRVTARVVYTAKGKEETLDLLKHPKEFESLAESRYVYTMDCGQTRSKLLSVTHLDVRNAPIKALDLSGVTEWEDIPPAARLELISDEVCSK